MTQTRARALRIFLFVALVMSVAALAADSVIETAAISDADISASAIQWQISASYERLILTVSGPDGQLVSKEFAAGRAAVLRVQDLGASGSADGQYNWELRVVPHVSAEVRRQLVQAREAGDEQAMARIQAEAGLNRDLVKSGTFAIHNGSFVSPRSEEPAAPGGRQIGTNALRPTPQDVVTADDEIIQGSLCVGLDCVVNESFGFDTIRLKENNTRIKFDDTSTASGFPANDWQLTANDSASGGASKFSIEDTTGNKVPFTIRAGAATNSIFVDSTGRVGFRTSTPVLDLHVTTSNTPAIRQEQTNAGGFTAQTWDIGANEANWFVRDVTGGSRLPLRIRPGAPTSSIDISASGDVGVGTASPSHLMDLRKNGGNARIGLHVQNDGTNTSDDVYLSFETTASRVAFAGIDRSTGMFTIAGSAGFGAAQDWLTVDLLNGNIGLNNVTAPANPIQHSSGAVLTAGGIWQNASSREIKEDICPLEVGEARETLLNLDPVKYAYKVAPKEHHVGFIAEDVPDLVAATDRKSLSPMDIVAVLTKVVQEQQKVIDQLSQRVEQLEKDDHRSQK